MSIARLLSKNMIGSYLEIQSHIGEKSHNAAPFILFCDFLREIELHLSSGDAAYFSRGMSSDITDFRSS